MQNFLHFLKIRKKLDILLILTYDYTRLVFKGQMLMTPIKPRITVDYTDKAVIIAFADERILEDKDVAAVQHAIMSVVEQTKRINLILDFSNVKFLSSAVLGLLIRVSKKVYERDGQLRLCNINPKIYEIFKITRLTKVFEIYADMENAVAGLSALE